MDVHIELTTETVWAGQWGAFYAVVTAPDGTGPFDARYILEHSSGDRSEGGLGYCPGLDAGQSFTSDETNFMPSDAGSHSLIVEVIRDGNVVEKGRHDFQVRSIE